MKTKDKRMKIKTLHLPSKELVIVPQPMTARQDEIAAILRTFHTSTVLHRDELVAEWVEIERIRVGQIDHPPAGGRQKTDKGIARAARVLAVPGKSEQGRRKFIERALQVASISPEAKAAAIAAGLDNNRAALRQIAKAPPELQVEKVSEIAEGKKARERLRRRSKPAPSQTASWNCSRQSTRGRSFLRR
jgi:hypothetical protein